MNKHLKVLFACLGVLTLSGCANPLSDTTSNKIPGKDNYSLDYFQINRFNVNLHVNETHQISVLAIPEKYVGSKITYRSKDQAVAEVSETGLVTAKSQGFTQVELLDGNNVVEKVNIAVSKDLTNNEVVEQCHNLLANMNDPGFKFDDRVIAHERAQEQFFVDGKVTSEIAYVEDMTLSVPDAYFKIVSKDISVLTEDGAIEHSSGAWEFFVDEYWMAYFFHDSPTEKNYYEVDCSGYISKHVEKIQIIYDILDMFFVDGATIATNMLDDAAGYRDVDDSDPNSETNGFIPDCFANDYTNVPAKKGGQSGEDDLFSSVTIADDKVKTITAEDEDDIDIESGTEYTESQILDSFYHNNRVEGSYIVSEMDYKLNDKPAKRIFSKEYRYERDFEIELPDFDAYQKVDQFYDL